MVAHYVAQHEDTAGAEDNATGVAVVMQAAKAIANLDLAFNVRVLLVGGVDVGTPVYIDSMTEDERAATIGVLNLDTISAGRLELVGAGELSALAATVAKGIGHRVRFDGHTPPILQRRRIFQRRRLSMRCGFGPTSHARATKDRIEYVSPDNLVDALEIVLGIIERLNEEYTE